MTNAISAILNAPIPDFEGDSTDYQLSVVLNSPIPSFFGGDFLAAVIESPTASFSGTIGEIGVLSALLKSPTVLFMGNSAQVATLQATLNAPLPSFTGLPGMTGQLNVTYGINPIPVFVGDIGISGGNRLSAPVGSPVPSFFDNPDPSLADTGYGVLQFSPYRHLSRNGGRTICFP